MCMFKLLPMLLLTEKFSQQFYFRYFCSKSGNTKIKRPRIFQVFWIIINCTTFLFWLHLPNLKIYLFQIDTLLLLCISRYSLILKIYRNSYFTSAITYEIIHSHCYNNTNQNNILQSVFHVGQIYILNWYDKISIRGHMYVVLCY